MGGLPPLPPLPQQQVAEPAAATPPLPPLPPETPPLPPIPAQAPTPQTQVGALPSDIKPGSIEKAGQDVWSSKPANTDPTKANYNVVESLAGHQELPFMAFNAWVMDQVEHTDGAHMKEMWSLWGPHNLGGQGKPGAASAIYGLNNPRVLDAYEKFGGPLAMYARTLKANPWLAGGATFVEEWFNPMSWAEGGAVGKIGSRVLGSVSKMPYVGKALDNLGHIMSAYKGIVAEHGTGPRNVLGAIGGRMGEGSNRAWEDMRKVFQGHDEAAQLEIVRRQQYLKPNTAAFSKEQNAQIDKAAALKRDITRALTAEKLATGAIKRDQVHGVKGSPATDLYDSRGQLVGQFDHDPGTYHGMAGQYSHPNSGYNELLGHLDAVSSGRPGPSLKTKTYDNIDDAMQSKVYEGDIDHATVFNRFLSTGYKRVEFEKGMRELAARHPDVITVPTTVKDKQRLLSTGRYIPVSDTKHSLIDMSGDKGSPFMKQALISKSFRNFLTDKNSMSNILGSSLAERELQSKWGQFGNQFTNAYRSTIIANPAYHPFWNVAPNASAAAGLSGPVGLANAMMNQTRAMLGAGATVMELASKAPVVGGLARGIARGMDFSRQRMERIYLERAQSYQNALHAALAAGKTADAAVDEATAAAHAQAKWYGASANMSVRTPAWGGDTGRIWTRPKAANTAEFWDRQLTRMDQWNKDATFGERGEEGFATTLFHQLYSETNKKALFYKDPYGAAWAVREALGNYRNISPENKLAKLIMFFPWLAGNAAFWFKTLAKYPVLATAPTQASRTQRENADDPTAYDPGHPHLGIEGYRGDGSHVTAPLPFKDAEKIAQSAYDIFTGVIDPGGTAPGVVDQGVQEGGGEIVDRLWPQYKTILDLAATHYDERANPAGAYVGYDVMYDKNLPDQRNVDIIKSTALELAPIPFPFVVRDWARQGIDPASVGDYIQEAAGMGYISKMQSAAEHRAIEAANNQLQSHMVRLRKIQAGTNPLPEQVLEARRKQFEDAYAKRMQAIKDRIDAQRAKKEGSGGRPPLPSSAAPQALPALPPLPPLPSGATATLAH